MAREERGKRDRRSNFQDLKMVDAKEERTTSRLLETELIERELNIQTRNFREDDNSLEASALDVFRSGIGP